MKTVAKKVATPGTRNTDLIDGSSDSSENGCHAKTRSGNEKSKKKPAREEKKKEEKKREKISRQLSRHSMTERLEPNEKGGKKKKASKKSKVGQ